ncbi:hypothetical protein BDV12DRAFT_184849 [Aspergillus spectabilis]
MGLIKRRKLDEKCPNMLEHGVDQHCLDPTTLISRLDRQLSTNNLQLNSQLGCDSLHIHGRRGALFKITLWSHRYTFTGKGTPVNFLAGANAAWQPATSPPFSYNGIAEIIHLMIMSYAGRTLAGQHDLDHDQLVQQANNSLQAIQKLGVLHGDPIPGNMTWNEENGRVMFIDFEQATLQTRRLPLGGISSNRKLSQEISPEKSPNKRLNCFERETRRMRYGL